MNSVMAFRADHECFAPPFRHQPCPFGLSWSRLAEVGELADVVNCHVARLPADLAFPAEQPQGQFFAGVADPFRDAVGDDRLSLSLEWYPAEPCDQRFPAVPFDGGLQAGPQAVRGLDLGLVS